MSDLPALLFAQLAAPLVSRADLRWEFANIAAAVALLTIALAAIALFFFRRSTRDLTLIFFGLFCILYSVRLLAANVPSFRLLFNESPAFWAYFNWVITCTIILPFGLFLYQIVGESLKRFIRWLIAVQAVFAVFGILAIAFGAGLRKLFIANNILVLATFVALALFVVATRRPGLLTGLTREIRVFIGGLVVWIVFIVRQNLVGLIVLPGRNVEFIGFLIFVACLGYVSARRIYANEERLLAINKELEIARQIQSSTLPRSIPALAGLEIVARYVPMSAVAGDFYDFLVIDEKHVGVLVADVTGHGVPAALIASMLKVAFAGQAAHAHDPACVLAGLNASLCGKFEEHFVTAAYLFIDLEKNLLCYSAAAHPPLLLASRGSGNVREVEENGLMLGMFPEAAYSSVEICVGSGDRCLLCTDGVFEAKNAAQEEFGKSRCARFLETHHNIPAALFADALLRSIAEFSGHNSSRAQEDDITLLVLDF